MVNNCQICYDQDQQSRELSQGHISKRAKKLRMKVWIGPTHQILLVKLAWLYLRDVAYTAYFFCKYCTFFFLSEFFCSAYFCNFNFRRRNLNWSQLLHLIMVWSSGILFWNKSEICKLSDSDLFLSDGLFFCYVKMI